MSSQEVFVFEVSESSFNSSVVLNSYKLPVVVEFMGVWSEPCIRMSDTLTTLAQEFAGQFVFAKVDVDEQPELRKTYSVENIPTLKVFKDGEVVHTEEGLLQEPEIVDLLKSYGVYRKSDEIRQQARQKHISGDTIEAINLLTQAIKQDPSNTRVAMDMVQVFLDIGEIDQAKSLFNKLPDKDISSDTGRALTGQFAFKDLALKTEGIENLRSRIDNNPDDHDAHFDLSICLVAEHDYMQAMNHLFVIFDSNPDYKDGAAKEMIINLCNMLAPNEPELAQDFRRRLGSAVL